MICAGVVELVDTPDLGSGDASHGGSSPFARTKIVFEYFKVEAVCKLTIRWQKV